MKWQNASDYIDAEIAHSAASVFYKKEFYVFGGIVKQLFDSLIAPSDKIVSFNPFNGNWQEIGFLSATRFKHSVLIIENVAYIFGGNGPQQTEACEYKRSSKTKKIQCLPANEIPLANFENPKLFSFVQEKCSTFANESYDYENLEPTAFLILFTSSKTNKLTSLTFNTGHELGNQFHTTTLVKSVGIIQIDKSCSVSHKNDIFIYGGSANRKQILTISSETKRLKITSYLNFDFEDGTCDSNNVNIMLCFAKDKRLCLKSRYPLSDKWYKSFTKVQKSVVSHMDATVSMSPGKCFEINFCKI